MKITYNSPVVLTFAIASVAFYFLNSMLTNALDPILVLQPHFDAQSISNYLALFTYTLGHADTAHLLGNMSLFLILGPIIEEKYGSRTFLLMILLTAFITAIFQISMFSNGLMGASGIVFMLIILSSFTRSEKGGIPLTFLLVIALYLGTEMVNSFKEDQVSQFAHIMGGLIGSVLGFIVRNKKIYVEVQPTTNY
jgi:membrane associated rhomboid family serine protease